MRASLNRTCCIEGCEQRILARSWCSKHYNRWLRHGNPLTTLVVQHKGNVQERFWAKVDKTSICWNWTGATTSGGYGNYSIGGNKTAPAHCFAYELTVGPIPIGLQIDHRCHNTLCVNPAHLRLATPKQQAENRRGARSDSASGIRGVSWFSPHRLWRAQVNHNGKPVYRKYFRTQNEAAAAVIEARNKFFTHNDIDRPRAKVQ